MQIKMTKCLLCGHKTVLPSETLCRQCQRTGGRAKLVEKKSKEAKCHELQRLHARGQWGLAGGQPSGKTERKRNAKRVAVKKVAHEADADAMARMRKQAAEVKRQEDILAVALELGIDPENSKEFAICATLI